jgi:hypothetical protein
MSAHTPGPWGFKHRAGSDGDYRTEVFSAKYGGIATCDWTIKNCGNGVTGTYREANARLIAAAPDLLAACIAMLAERTGAAQLSDACQIAREAITKATE